VVPIRARPSRRGMMRRSGHHQAPPARIILWKGGPAALDCLFEGVPVPGGTKIRCKHIIEGGFPGPGKSPSAAPRVTTTDTPHCGKIAGADLRRSDGEMISKQISFVHDAG